MNMLKKYNLIFILMIGVVLLISAPKGFAAPFTATEFDATGNPLDNASGEAYTADATYETINYTDANSNSKPTTFPATDINWSVYPEYGFSGIGDASDADATPGDIVTLETYNVTNEGNTNLYDLTWSYYFTQEAGANNWTVEVYVNGGGTVYTSRLTAGVISNEAAAIDDNQADKRWYEVEIPANVADAPNGSYVVLYATLETNATPVGKYTGGNTLTYGGTSDATDDITISLNAPLLTLTRVATIDAPKTYTGVHEDAVPGAIITFTMSYSNEGGASAESIVLIDKVPDNTHLACVNTSGNTTNVTISNGLQGTATGWDAYYSTTANPTTEYGNYTGWTTLGAVDTTEYPGSDTTWTSGEATWEATFVKWEKSSIEPGENETLTWGVTID
jgi:uncharacterized repeat protein (TIGR01451 family)